MAYIHGDAHRWAEFVQNRVTEIDELKNTRWHHVPGKENPAALAPGGVSPLQLASDQLWWKGPAWLSKHSTFWPSCTPPVDPDTVFEIRKKHANLANQENHQEIRDLVERFSNFNTLLRISVWVFRTSRRFLKVQCTEVFLSPLTPNYLEKARLFWVRATQQAYFEKELCTLQNKAPISRSSALIRLTPFVDAAGLLRVGGRRQNSFYAHDEKHPLILPKESPLTTLFTDYSHRSTLHGGTQLTISTLRRQYWFAGNGVPIRSFLHRCIVCVPQRTQLGQQLMGQLPASRLTQARPVLNTGVDLAGPITLRTYRGRGAKTYKGYIVVFVCFSSSAVHLELVTDYTTEAFLASFKRFTSRRGLCATITSDCGTNLIGAASELQRLFQACSTEFAHLTSALTSDGVLWKFNPPSAPHFGGKWEAAVKSVKFHLKRIIGDATLTYEEYLTFLVQVKAVLNSRPLCALSDDPSDLSALTPGHFLIGSALNAVPKPSLIELPTSRLSRWQLLRQMLDHFWARWRIEYIQQLQATSKWQKKRDNIAKGTLVLVTDERYPPLKWAFGRVIDLHPGRDNFVRIVIVRTQKSTLKRPIFKIMHFANL